MKKSFVHIIVLFLLLPAALLQAQAPALQLRTSTDQPVYITGEDIWIDLQFAGSLGNAKTLRIRLIDRSGQSKAQVEIVPNGNGGSAFMSIPENLPSDYYFIDAYARGIATSTSLKPVMIINPMLPPAACMASGTSSSNLASSNINIQTDKQVYAGREEVKLTVNGLSDIQQLNIVAIRQDQLSVMMDETATGRILNLAHDANGDVEGEGHHIKAKVTAGGKPLSGLKLTASLKGSRSSLATGTTDVNGIVQFILPLHYGQTSLLISPSETKGTKPIIEIIEQQTERKSIAFPCLALKEEMRTDIEERIFNSRVSKRFYGDASRAYSIPDRDTSDFYGKPDERFLLDEYVRFPNMEEVIAEIIPPLRVKKEGGVQMLQVLNLPTKSFFEKEPLLLVDGVPLQNSKALIESDPLLVRSIDIVTRRYYIGEVEFSGIAHFKTYRGDRALLSNGDNDLITAFKGVQETATLQAPVFNTSNERMPDSRNILLKEQSLKPDASGTVSLRFNTSDAVGTYKIVVKGLNKAGQEISASSVITVK
jgi:hypothetical protein